MTKIDKFKYFLFGVTMSINIMFGIYIVKREPVCEHIHIDVIDRSKDVVSDEEMAVKIAKILLSDGYEKYKGKYIVDIETSFNEASYEWIVIFTLKTLDGRSLLDGIRIVGVRRDNAYAMGYAWLEDIKGYMDSNDWEGADYAE